MDVLGKVRGGEEVVGTPPGFSLVPTISEGFPPLGGATARKASHAVCEPVVQHTTFTSNALGSQHPLSQPPACQDSVAHCDDFHLGLVALNPGSPAKSASVSMILSLSSPTSLKFPFSLWYGRRQVPVHQVDN
jgi:hypothetical protein